MALRQIRKVGDDVLRKISKPVVKFDKRLKILVEDMIDTMYEADGVGLAAPQVGILKRVIVIDVGDGPKAYINPEIIYEEGEQIDDEGCLSVPNRRGPVKRPYKVKVKAQDINGNEFIEEGEELLARAFCHEIDHLNGVLFIDKIIEQGE
ncbi:peptide deformylase [Caloramator proteoclasticus]|uniref:Peptide deformylase n=1 Tax=Caloramator proteoclasticus DSM 10124 TaxID=1121262 RepID=A0A1M5ANM3_9CLOT|nr:peptide deformylase [Caloramator proteoclasticus]SHF31754.1 peptide deformylase [Caloramator proteoclasticus DSM 10124]